MVNNNLNGHPDDTAESVIVEEEKTKEELHYDPITRKKLKKSKQSQAIKHAMIIDLRRKGTPIPMIAKAVDLTADNVRDIIKRFKPVFQELEEVNSYRSIKSDLLAAGQLAALKTALSPKKLAKASFMSAVTGFDILNKAERLENNKSTDNIAHKHFGSVTLEEDK